MASVLDFDVWNNYVQIIDGQSSPTKQTRNGVNPANLQDLPPVPVATQVDLDRAVAAGKAAFIHWSQVPYEDRRKAVLAYADALEHLRLEFQTLLTTEQGKPVSSSSRQPLTE